LRNEFDRRKDGVAGQQLVDRWNWAAEKGLMNKNTASGRRSACVHVLSIVPDWQNVDVSQLNISLGFRTSRKRISGQMS
jgi:hypothetical protein